MRLWPRRAGGGERRAARLVADHLGTRSLPEALRTAIERAVAAKLRHAPLAQLDEAMRAAIDRHALAESDANGDEGPATVIDVRWTGRAAP